MQDQDVLPALDIYKSKALGAALYGAELWGQDNLPKLSTAENNFIRALTGLPQSTPLLPMLMDLGLRPIGRRIGLRSLLYWRRIWCSPELAHYKVALQEVLSLVGNRRIPWLTFVKKQLGLLGLAELWDTPTLICSLSKTAFKEIYCNYVMSCSYSGRAQGRLTMSFLDIKSHYFYESFLDRITPPHARQLYLKLRYGTLPLNSFNCRWSSSTILTDKCQFCPDQVETTHHVFFFCPEYTTPRKKWIVPLCRSLGTMNYQTSLRILITDTGELVVFGVSRFLLILWRIRAKKFGPK